MPNLTLYRGEKNNWWPAPEVRLICGMTLYGPWQPTAVSSLWNTLKNEVKGALGTSLEKKVAVYAQYLRATGRPFALATAWTDVGSFTSDYNYVIRIPNAHFFYWGGTKDAPELGAAAAWTTPEQVTADFIVLNAPTVAASTILGFGHHTGTREITFFHDLPLGLIESCNGKPITDYAIKSKSDLSFDEKIKYAKYLR